MLTFTRGDVTVAINFGPEPAPALGTMLAAGDGTVRART